MSSCYSANQYESSFKSNKLQSWTIPKQFKERPSAAEGHTTFIATDRGHLLPGVKSKPGSAWSSFQGTWDLPNKIPPVQINPTARSQEGLQRLLNLGQPHHLQRSASQKQLEASRAASRPPSEMAQAMIPAPDEAALERPISGGSKPQSRPTTQQSSTEMMQAAEKNQESRPNTQQRQDGYRPPTQDSQAQSRPGTQTYRPLSKQSDVLVESA